MPSEQDIQNVILSASYKNALAVKKNYAYIQKGGLPKNEANINYIWLNIDGLQYLLSLGIFGSAAAVTLYDRLNRYVGFDTTVNNLDPNAQIPGIVIENVVGSPAPIASIPFSSFDAATQLPDGGRVIYYNANWKGFNPLLELMGPVNTSLNLGIDYVLIPTGGIQLLNTSPVLPEIYDGQSLRASAYVTA